MISTPHINCQDKNLIAKTVLMPGDPLRARFIAETFLTNVTQFNNVRGILGFTGDYNGKKISVMASGMGMPSIGIYSYELFKFYDVDRIVRIGSAGAYTEKLDLYDVVLATSAYSESTFAKIQSGETKNTLESNEELNSEIREIATKLEIPLHEGVVHSSDVFYRSTDFNFEDVYKEKGALCVEMESFALFNNANVLGKKATCLLTISDNLVTHELTTSEERQTAFTNMMKIALELA